MRKVFLSLVAVLLCGVTFAQTTKTINSEEDFKKIGKDPDYPVANVTYNLAADLNLGTYSESNNFVITTFSGTFNGNNHTITYQASFTATDNAKIGLFGTVSGTIKNLNLDADITVSGEGEDVNIGLLCGAFQRNTTAETVIEFCDVTGNINSTVKAGTIGHSSTGLIVGSNLDTLQYCTGHGNVTGVGYVGGLVGSMGTVRTGLDNNEKPLIKGCYFTGNVTANNSSTDAANGLAALINGISGLVGGATDMALQSFGGGICGTMRNPAKIELCVAEAIVVVGNNAAGITTTSFGATWLGWGSCGTAQSNYATGTINGISIGSDDLVDKVISSTNNPAPTNSPNYPTNSVTDLQTIVDNLNAKRCPNANNCDDQFYFAVINGKIVLIVGEITEYVCDAPIGLTVTTGENGTFTASWSVNNQDATVNETTFRYTLTNNGTIIQSGTTTNTTANGALEAKTTPYKLTIESDCSASQSGLYSDAITYTFYVNANCPSVSGLQVTNITPNTAKVSWTGDAEVVELNGEEIELTSGETLTGLTPATDYIIEAIVYCEINGQVVERPTTVTFTTEITDYVTAQSGPFYTATTWVGGKVPTGNPGTTITISDGHKVRLNGTLVLKGTIINNGVLLIPQTSGQLINKTNVNVLGIVEIETGNKTMDAWTFVGAPFEDYTLGAVVPTEKDVAMVKYDYTEGDWSDAWAHYHDEMDAAEGAFAWPFYGGAITFSTHNFGASTNSNYLPNATVDYALNNDDVTVSESTVSESTLQNTAGGYWMALANPYPAKLSVKEFLQENSSRLQGGVAYVYYDKSGETPHFDIVTKDLNTTANIDTNIGMTQGFFVNFKDDAEKFVTFKKSQLTDWNGETNVNNIQAKSSANELIELTLQNGNDKVRVYFAHNEEAEQGYDIFDANKMFATTGVAEPYFVTDGIALIKEEVAELPYYATMNVRSQEDTVMNFVLTNLPEGYAVSIIDGEEVIDMVEGGVYSTEILTGENADRFKVLVKKNVGIADVEELDVTITNNNRQVNITADKAVRTEVYNILGQKVFETNNTTFVLDNVASGAYVVKVYGASASKTQKIVVE